MRFRNFAAVASLPMAFALLGNAAPVAPPVPPVPHGATLAQAPEAGERYTLAMTITDNGELIAEPVLHIETGAKARVKIVQGLEDAQRSYQIDLLFSDAGEGMVGMKSQIDATSPSLGTIGFAPELTIRESQPVRVEYGNVAPGIRPLQIKFTLTPED